MGIASTSPSLSNQITVKVSPSAAPGAPTEPFSQPLTSRILTLSEIDSRLRELQNALRAGGALQYFPGDQKNQETVVQRWIAQVGQFAELVQLLRRSQISQLHELEIRKNLTEAVTQLEFRRPYEVKLVGHTGAGKTTILAAILGEDFFPIWSGDTVTGARTRILFSDTQTEEMRIHFLDQQRPVENYERKDWQKTALKYIAQPLTTSANSTNSSQTAVPNQSKEVSLVEVVLNTNAHPILPPNSVIVDLPGGMAGIAHHDAILDSELDHVDAVILFAGGNRYRNDLVTPIFKAVKEKVARNRKVSHVSRMIFLVATYWDGTSKDASLEASVNAMRTLARDSLGMSYINDHHHGPKQEYPFYPIRGKDAFFSGIYKDHRIPGKDLQKEAKDYLGRLWAVQSELQELMPNLPTLASPDAAVIEHHQAMWRYSGVPELVQDLQTFLTTNRFEVQLDRAREELQKVFWQLEESSWEHIEQYITVSVRDSSLLQGLLTDFGDDSPRLKPGASQKRVF